MNTQEKNEALSALYSAQESLFDAIEYLEKYVGLSGDQEAKCYLVDHLQIMASSDHGFMSRDLNIDDLIERVS